VNRVWEIVFYKTPNGACPVADFIAVPDAKTQAKIARALDLLEKYGSSLGMPHVRALPDTGGLRELRIPFGGQAYRLLFFADGNTLVLVHGFVKKAPKLPGKELRTAAARMKDYLQRRNCR
jgi:phage-related protein